MRANTSHQTFPSYIPPPSYEDVAYTSYHAPTQRMPVSPAVQQQLQQPPLVPNIASAPPDYVKATPMHSQRPAPVPYATPSLPRPAVRQDMPSSNRSVSNHPELKEKKDCVVM